MLKIEARKIFSSKGLVDDLVVYGKPEDYLFFSEVIKTAISSSRAVVLSTDSPIRIEVSRDNESEELFTSLQNENNKYYSIKEWEERSILRVIGSEKVLNQLHSFLVNLTGKGEGYSYISEYSDSNAYSHCSPEWRLHIQND